MSIKPYKAAPVSQIGSDKLFFAKELKRIELPLAVSFKAVRHRLFTSSGVYTPDPGLLFGIAEAQGAGGGGGGIAGAVGLYLGSGGGQGGGYSRAIFLPEDVEVNAVTVGAGGAGGAAGLNNGSAGGHSGLANFTSWLCLAYGGLPGQGASSAAYGWGSGVGGTHAAGVGDLTTYGEHGNNAVYSNAPTYYMLSNGGNSHFGSGGQCGWLGAGNPGFGYGGGGAGVYVASAASNYAGGAGAPGCVLITEFCSA